MAESKTPAAKKPAAKKTAAAKKPANTTAPAAAEKKTTKKVEAKPAAKKSVAKKTDANAPLAARLLRVSDAPIGGQIKVTQTTGSIARQGDQRATLKGLGLNKRHRSRVLEDTAAVRGMIYKVRHLVAVEKVS